MTPEVPGKMLGVRLSRDGEREQLLSTQVTHTGRWERRLVSNDTITCASYEVVRVMLTYYGST